MKLNWVSKLLLALATVGLVVYVWPKSNKGISKSPPPAVVAVEKSGVMEVAKPISPKAETEPEWTKAPPENFEVKAGGSKLISHPSDGKHFLYSFNKTEGYEMWTFPVGNDGKPDRKKARGPFKWGDPLGKADFVEISSREYLRGQVKFFDSREELAEHLQQALEK